MKIYFDMDGTLVDLYGVENWLEKLEVYDNTPYLEAKPLVNMNVLARQLNRLRKQGYEIGIITWLSKGSTAEYDKQVREAKRKWLAKHLPSVIFDEVHMVRFGRSKNTVVQDKNGILFDDSEDIRSNWNGQSYEPKEIIAVLKSL